MKDHEPNKIEGCCFDNDSPLVRAHILANEIEVFHAKALAALPSRKKYRTPWEYFYDPHAATELGNLIYNRMCESEREIK